MLNYEKNVSFPVKKIDAMTSCFACFHPLENPAAHGRKKEGGRKGGKIDGTKKAIRDKRSKERAKRKI